MILIDTNVFSEIVKPRPDDRVVGWLFEHRRETLLSAIVVAELCVGIRTTPGPGKRALLFAWLERLIEEHAERTAVFDVASARRWGDMAGGMIISERRSAFADSLIAAQALVLGIPVATRNRHDFEACGVDVTDPWLA